METKRQSTLWEFNGVGNHRIARRRAYSFTNAIRQAYCQHLMPVAGERKQRSHDRGECVTADYETLPFACSIAEMTGKEFQ